MNSRAKLIVVGVLLLSLGLGGGYWFAMHRMQGGAQGGMTASADARAVTGPVSQRAPGDKIDPKTGRKVLYWHDPMVPGPKFDQPGKSPFMDMQLVPVYADEAGDAGKIAISPRTEQNLGIRTAHVKEGNMAMAFSTVGGVSIDDRGITTVQSRVNGYVEKLYVRAQYDEVKRGQRLLEVYAPDWLSAEEEYLALKRMTQPGTEMLAEAARQRLKLLGISEDQIQAIEKSGKANPRVTLSAPESGVVWELGTREGMAVSPGMTLFKLATLSTVWVNADVPESQAELIKPGVPVEARVAAVPGKTFKGQVTALLPDVNATTRTIKARIVLRNPGSELKPGMFATLTFGGAEKPSLMVPSEAVIATGKRNVVILANEGKFQPVDVQIGRETGGMTEITGGLKAGQQIVVSGQFLIDSEASLKGVETGWRYGNRYDAGGDRYRADNGASRPWQGGKYRQGRHHAVAWPRAVAEVGRDDDGIQVAARRAAEKHCRGRYGRFRVPRRCRAEPMQLRASRRPRRPIHPRRAG